MYKLLKSLLLLFAGLPLYGQPTIVDVASEVHINNVLRYDIVVETTAPARAFVAFGQTNLDRYSSVSEPGTVHNLTIYGLKPNTAYQFQAIAFDSLGQSVSSLFSFTTGNLPSDIITPTSVVNNSSEEGYYMVNLESTEPRQTNIIDREGQVVWYERTEVPGAPCTGFFWTEQNTLLYLLEDCHTVQELSLAGSVLREVILPDTFFVHHEFFLNKEGHLVAMVATGREIDKTPVGGPEDALVVGDGIVEYDWEGNQLYYWTTFDHFDPLSSVEDGSFWDPYFGNTSEDWLHANSISVDLDGNYLFGVRNQHQIHKIHRETGDIMWSFGMGGDFDFANATDMFLEQHAFIPTGPNQYLLFDNLGISGLSRTLEFSLDTEDFEAQRIETFGTQVNVFTPVVGNALRLPNGHTTTVFGQKGRIVEETEDLEIAWDLSYDVFTYRAYFQESLNPVFPSIQLLDSAICLENGTPLPAPFYPEANLSGGYFEGPGIVNGLFDPSLVGPGVHSLSYHFGPITEEVTIYIEDFPAPTTISQNNDLLIAAGGNRWQWYLNDEPIPGATSMTYQAVDLGTYQVATLSAGGCASFSDPLEVNVLSTQDLVWEQSDLLLFPNPASNFLNIRWGFPIQKVQIMNSKGQTLQTSKADGNRKMSIALNDLPSGLYWVQVQGEQEIGMERLLIQ